MDFSFETYGDELVTTSEQSFQSVEPVDAMQFVTSSEYLNEDPTVFQSILLKTFYGLWTQYPPTPEENDLLTILWNNWRLKVDLNCENIIEKLILVLGRRSTKTTSLSFIATYEMYKLICRGNPQSYYGIRDRHRIHITHVAASGEQAEEVFSMTADNIKRVPFFRSFIDFDKDNSTELRLFSPYDLYLNKQVRARNNQVLRGMMKENTFPGSLYVESITTSAASSRGRAIIVLMLSEFSHLLRAKINSTATEEQILSENKMSDYAIYKALAPSVKDFGIDGKILMESSPAEKGGEFYSHYCLGGGHEQEDADQVEPLSGYQVLQFSTWEARPTITRETLEPEFVKDPVGSSMEYGAHFGNPSGAFIPESLIVESIQSDHQMMRFNPGETKFIITIDPGGKAKKKQADTYAIAWGHSENNYVTKEINYVVDGLCGFDSKIKPLGNGKYEQISVDPNIVLDFIIQLVEDLGGRNHILEIVYDQFDSSSPISTLQGLGIPAIETTFTNTYKSEMYGDYLQQLHAHKVKIYGIDPEGWIDRWKLEMKFLQQITSGKFVYYGHPTSGPVQHDDMCTVVSNLVHRLCLYETPTKEGIAEARKHGTGPIQVKRTGMPRRGPGLWSGGNRNMPTGRNRFHD